MTDTPEQFSPISIPIETRDHKQAYQFAEQQPTAEKSEQVYRNTLAVLITQRYLRLLGVETTLEDSHSWHPLERVLENVADLYIPSLQTRLECRPVKQCDRKCTIPKEVWEDRVGYVVVQLAPPYQTGHLLGFVETVSVTELPLSYLKPLEDLIPLFLDRSDPPPLNPLVPLHRWLDRVFEPAWSPPAELLSAMGKLVFPRVLSPQRGDSTRRRLEKLYQQQSDGQAQTLPANLSDQDALVNLIETAHNDNIRWQSAELLWEINPRHPACPIMTAKDLGLYLTGHQVALAVGVLPKIEGSLLILTRVYPLGDLSYLPPGLTLIGLTETDNTFFEVVSRQQDNYIQFKFTADEGDRFKVRVTLNGVEFIESFVV